MSKAAILYRQMLAEAKRITVGGLVHRVRTTFNAESQHYNVREYAKRRIKLGFEESRSLRGEAAEAAYAQGLEELAALRRQATIVNLYPVEASVMESARPSLPSAAETT